MPIVILASLVARFDNVITYDLLFLSRNDEFLKEGPILLSLLQSAYTNMMVHHRRPCTARRAGWAYDGRVLGPVLYETNLPNQLYTTNPGIYVGE